MRAGDPSVSLTPEQQRVADAGLKAMLPINGRPFLDYVLSSLADAGLREVALVVAPDHQAIREYYSSNVPSRVVLSYVVQPEALGTANALTRAEQWSAAAPFLTLNADNLYPPAELKALASLDEPGLSAFDADELVRTGNIPAERVRAFALIEIGPDGYLKQIVEKPATGPRPEHGSRDDRLHISMNCWRFDSRIFDACRAVPLSSRGEYELPEAVAVAMRRGVRFKALRARGPVLDLSRRADMADVARRLADITPVP